MRTVQKLFKTSALLMLATSLSVVSCKKDDNTEVSPVDVNHENVDNQNNDVDNQNNNNDQTEEPSVIESEKVEKILELYEVQLDSKNFLEEAIKNKKSIEEGDRLMIAGVDVKLEDKMEGNKKVGTWLILDFGQEGVKQKNGNLIKGLIKFSYRIEKGEDTNGNKVRKGVAEYLYENFSTHGYTFDGGAMFAFDKLKKGVGGFESTYTHTTMDPQGGVFHTEGEMKMTIDISSDAQELFSLSGNWSTTFKDGSIYACEITSDLKKNADCKYITGGKIKVTCKNDWGTLDFGNGECTPQVNYLDSKGNKFNFELGKN